MYDYNTHNIARIETERLRYRFTYMFEHCFKIRHGSENLIRKLCIFSRYNNLAEKLNRK